MNTRSKHCFGEHSHFPRLVRVAVGVRAAGSLPPDPRRERAVGDGADVGTEGLGGNGSPGTPEDPRSILLTRKCL